MSRRVCFAMDLVADDALIAEYERRHFPGAVWPEVVRDIHDLASRIWKSGGWPTERVHLT
jgi:L-rhamnose mutarotase